MLTRCHSSLTSLSQFESMAFRHLCFSTLVFLKAETLFHRVVHIDSRFAELRCWDRALRSIDRTQVLSIAYERIFCIVKFLVFRRDGRNGSPYAKISLVCLLKRYPVQSHLKFISRGTTIDWDGAGLLAQLLALLSLALEQRWDFDILWLVLR